RRMCAPLYRRPAKPSRPREYFGMNNAFVRLVAAFCLVGAGIVGFHHFACNTSNLGESDSHLVPPAVIDYVDGVAVSTDLQSRTKSNFQRTLAKHAVVTELLDDRLTLLAAAARFQELDAEVPGIRDRLAKRYPGLSTQEAWCHEVIEQARAVLRGK